MSHRDGPLYHPLVAIISTGGTVAMDITATKYVEGVEQQNLAPMQALFQWRLYACHPISDSLRASVGDFETREPSGL